MSKTFFGFGIAPSMFPSNCRIARKSLTADDVRLMAEELTPCLNPSHEATIGVMEKRFGISVPIPEKAPVVKLEVGDSVVVMGVSGLPRLEGRHEYAEEEIAGATFSFSVFSVTE